MRTQQDQHTNQWDANTNLIHQPTPDGLEWFVSWWPKPYHIPLLATMATTDKTRLNGQYRRSKPTTLAEQPQCTSQTSTSGPLIRRRVIIHVEDNTPKPANRLPTHRLFRTHTRRHYDISAASRESKTTTTKKISQSFPAYQFLYLRPSAKEYPLRKQIPRPTNSDNHSYPFFHRQRSPRNTKHKD